MAQHLFITVWANSWGQTGRLDLPQKQMRIAATMRAAKSYMQAAAIKMGAANPIFLFSAPEYFWVKNQETLEKFTSYDEHEKNQIYTDLATLSSRILQDLIIIPGSVSWEIPIGDYVGPALARNPDTLNKNVAKLAFNTTPVFLNGKKIYEYYKKFNDHSVDKYVPDAAFVAGPSAQTQTFRQRDLTFGIEVCGDFNDGKLNIALGGNKIDVEVMISATMTHAFTDDMISRVPVRDGGVFVHCDAAPAAQASKDTKNGVWVLARGKGWHGTPTTGDVLTFKDLDGQNRQLVAPLRKGLDDATTFTLGGTFKVTLSGVGGGLKLDATVNQISRSGRTVEKFTVVIPTLMSGGSPQTVTVETKEGKYQITLKRAGWFGASKIIPGITHSNPDSLGMHATGWGNVSKIGRLLPGPTMGENLYSYYVPI